jgi:EmrB/QacA subfamily drug resistance transporter
MPRRWLTLVAVSLATFMTYLDNNIVNVAIPTIERSLHLSVAGLEWVVSGYVLVFAGLMLVGGRLADVYGRRRLFLIGLSVFTLSSLAAGLAGSGTVLITFRAVQGLGAAMLVPTTLAIIIATFDDIKERTQAIGLWTAIGALALAVGPLIGGFISENFRWGWIFFINVPVGAVTFAMAVIWMAESHGKTASRRLDIPGLTASAVTLFSLTYALIEGHDKGWTSALILGSFALSAVAAAAFVMIEARSKQPMVAVSLFRSRVFSGGTGVMMMWAFGIFGIYFFTSLYLQGILHFSPERAGLAFVPMALFVVVFAVLSGPVTARIGARWTVAIGLAIMTGGLVLFAGQGLHATYLGLMPGFVLFGAGSGLMNAPLTSAVLDSMPTDRSGVASALMNASREVAGLLGITVIGAVLRSREGVALRHGATPAGAFVDGYHAGLTVTIGLAAAAIVVALVALRRVDHQAAGPVAADALGANALGAEPAMAVAREAD